jgi:prepilin-type N-terminal cleavage/methylation domain-containing protein
MDILRKSELIAMREDGFSLIETLVVILLLGLLVTFTASFFNDLFNKPALFLKYQALRLADREMNYCLNNQVTTDTSYIFPKHNLNVQRTITEELNGYDINVSVSVNNDLKNNIVSLSAFEKR